MAVARASFLSVEGLTKRFGALSALDGVSFEVEEGTIFSIVGPNGSGKSTALACIGGQHPPTAGVVRLRGERISGLAPHRIARLGVARTFQGVELSAGATTLESVMLGRHRHMRTGPWAGLARVGGFRPAAREERAHRARVWEILELLDLVDVAGRPVGTLPYGTCKRVELGRALATEPSLLLADEPSAGMSGGERARIARIMRTLNAELGLTILLIEHDVELALGLAHRVLALGLGRPVALGDPDEVRRHPDVLRSYLGDA